MTKSTCTTSRTLYLIAYCSALALTIVSHQVSLPTFTNRVASNCIFLAMLSEGWLSCIVQSKPDHWAPGHLECSNDAPQKMTSQVCQLVHLPAGLLSSERFLGSSKDGAQHCLVSASANVFSLAQGEVDFRVDAETLGCRAG